MITYHLDLWIALGFVAQFVLPPLVGLVTTKVQPDTEKALLLAALTAVIAVVTAGLSAHASNTPFDIVQALIDALGGFIVSVCAHFGIWRPTGVTEKALGTFRKAPALPATPGVTAPAADPSAPPAGK